MIKIPDEIKIGGYKYIVTLTDKTIVLNRQECKGMIDYEFHEIKINNQVQDRQGQEQTFLHELLHGIINERNIEVEDEETIVEEISRGLYQVLKDNKNLFESEELK